MIKVIKDTANDNTRIQIPRGTHKTHNQYILRLAHEFYQPINSRWCWLAAALAIHYYPKLYISQYDLNYKIRISLQRIPQGLPSFLQETPGAHKNLLADLGLKTIDFILSTENNKTKNNKRTVAKYLLHTYGPFCVAIRTSRRNLYHVVVAIGYTQRGNRIKIFDPQNYEGTEIDLPIEAIFMKNKIRIIAPIHLNKPSPVINSFHYTSKHIINKNRIPIQYHIDYVTEKNAQFIQYLFNKISLNSNATLCILLARTGTTPMVIDSMSIRPDKINVMFFLYPFHVSRHNIKIHLLYRNREDTAFRHTLTSQEAISDRTRLFRIPSQEHSSNGSSDTKRPSSP